MADWAESFKAIQNLPARYPFTASAIGLTFLLMPESVATTFGIVGILAKYRAWIGITTIVVLAFGLVQLMPWIQRRSKKKAKIDSILGYIDSLSYEERVILAECVRKRQQTINLDITLPPAMSLCDKGLLRKAGGRGEPHVWPHTVPPFVWDHLQVHPTFLLTEDDEQKVKSAFEGLTHVAEW